ncbi:PA2169 family four-helix-bundle protein [Hymenobacter cheonanensis]|uniref:PA2169 family four-helix-bundle protein n=1 Tax=Hymenobacter sp. CA2-7 TaxID=3063993 RepID=UPI0027140D3F|nr:PA2169 family four-helix-bundle protein [Hymenobacter sp. CA2-7]MDO7886354.1 PA2169 family four-helix-bundle protein [Hymenobacter sp. CA2-7]
MNLPEPISDAADKAKDLYTETADKAKDLYGTAADKAKSLYDEAAEKSKDLLGHVPDSVKDATDKTVGAYNKLTTTQKVVGGALLAAGLAYLVAPKKKGKAKRAKAALERLLLFVNDRIEGYKRAVAETKDAHLKSYYQKLVGQSQDFSKTLNDYLTKKGGERETGTTLKGKLYRKLMDAQALVTARDEKAILAANVYGEQWAIKAYKKALRRKALKGNLREAVEKQYAESKKTYKKLKELTAQTA